MQQQINRRLAARNFIISELRFYRQTEIYHFRAQILSSKWKISWLENSKVWGKKRILIPANQENNSRLLQHPLGPPRFSPPLLPSRFYFSMKQRELRVFCCRCCRWWPWGTSPTAPWWRWWPGMTRITRRSCATPRPPWRTRWRGSTTCASWAGVAEVRGENVPVPSSGHGIGIFLSTRECWKM